MHKLSSIVTIAAICAAAFLTRSTAYAAPDSAETNNLLLNGGFEQGDLLSTDWPDYWSRGSYDPSAIFVWDDTQAFEGSRSVKIEADTTNDAFWLQTVPVQPNTTYRVSGWIKTENVGHTSELVDRGANLSIMGTWESVSIPLFGTNDWTYVSFGFNSGDRTEVVIAARLGYWAGTTTGSAWFDDLEVAPILPSDPHPSWKILALIYGRVDFTDVDSAGVSHHYLGEMNQQEKDQAALMVTRFVEDDIPALNSSNMIPTLTIRYPERALTGLSRIDSGWWPDPTNTAPERDPAFDSVIVIWDPWVLDETTGQTIWIGYGAGLSPDMGTGQTYTSIIIDAMWYGHRNVFKHEWGHNITSFYNAYGTAPKPAVDNHIDNSYNPYVHCTTGEPYILEDETDVNPIPNSIYNNLSGFTHDYYSGTTATPDQPTRCLGITPEAWASGGPASKPLRPLTALQQIESIRGNINEYVIRGDLSEGRAKPLLNKLEAASRALENQRGPMAVKSLQLFIHKVEGLIRSGSLLETDGKVLIQKATTLIQQLQE